MATPLDCVTLYLTQMNKNDDIIRIRRDNEYHSVFDVRYKAHDMSHTQQFFMSESDVIHYITDLFRSLDVDVDPFVNLQVMTLIHPTVMYCVADLGDCCVRTTILDTIRMALRTKTHRIRTAGPK